MSRLILSLVVVAAVFLGDSQAFGQIFYAPVQVQYTPENGTIFYYGGVNPNVFAQAERQACLASNIDRLDDPRVDGDVHPIPVQRATLVYGDCLGWLGYRSSDGIDAAVNEANAQVPRYVAKSQTQAVLEPDGTLLAPIRPAEVDRLVRSGAIVIKPFIRTVHAPTTRPVIPANLSPSPAVPTLRASGSAQAQPLTARN